MRTTAGTLFMAMTPMVSLAEEGVAIRNRNVVPSDGKGTVLVLDEYAANEPVRFGKFGSILEREAPGEQFGYQQNDRNAYRAVEEDDAHAQKISKWRQFKRFVGSVARIFH